MSYQPSAENDDSLTPARCWHCGKLLFMAAFANLQIICPRCGKMNYIFLSGCDTMRSKAKATNT